MPMSTKSQGQFTPTAAVLAWLWPGLGHVSLGQRKRGVLVMFGVLWLFVGGVLIGGIDSVDRRDDPLWFLAQSLCGPIALAVDWTNQTWLKHVPVDPVELDRLAEQGDLTITSSLDRKGLGHVNEMGTLFSALGGLMNLVAILDVLYVPARRWGRSQPRSETR
ncbi:MAG: hypothetical protein IH888_07170 [Planctomycetes bacterium]|nr:hypothetical protein [Planctomycetota bacterium]